MQMVNWYDAIQFCNWLSDREGYEPCYLRQEDKSWHFRSAADGYRLPTSDEWEYACRTRTATTFSFGNDARWLDRYAVFQQLQGTSEVGSLRCNAWGLFDMHGNVQEWCHSPTPSSALASQTFYRGGSWSRPVGFCPSSALSQVDPALRAADLGFRVARGR
jgi:formylglycine-generating enzyme required for sulfatase activity